jgi:uncharacterized DUF497 family protein
MNPKASLAFKTVVLISPMQPERFLILAGLVQSDARHSYGEERFQLMGAIERRLFVVIYTLRQESIRIISARKANQREVRHYEDSTHDN